MHFGRFNPHFVYKFDNEGIQQVNREKDLGILFGSQLKFHAHTALVAC